MEHAAEKPEVLQWHPAFYAGLQIELEEDRENLIFENEHQLSTKPMEIDVLVVKKEKDLPVRKNIGQIFRMYNIIEYKSPSDYLSVDDFYKVYGYACFYKADTGTANAIQADQITITLVSEKYPMKLFAHLQKERGLRIEKVCGGIYYINGDYIPIQVIVTRQLSPKENLWLRSLTDHLTDYSDAEELIREYGKHKNEQLYASVLDIIVRANKKKFEEVKVMCDALKELMMEDMKKELDAAMQIGIEQGIERGIEQGIERGIEQGIERGIEQGIERGIQSTLRESILDFLSDFGEVPEDILSAVENEKDVILLKRYNKKAASVESIEEFRILLRQCIV